MESIKNLKSKISKYISNVFNKIKEIAKNINTPSYANFIYISYFYLIITATIIRGCWKSSLVGLEKNSELENNFFNSLFFMY